MDVTETLKEYGLTPEKYEELLKDCSDKVNKITDIDWAEINEKYNLGMNPDTLRKGSQPPLIGSVFVNEYFKEKYAKENCIDEDSYMKELQIMKREIEKERKKLQTEKLDYNKYLREEARDELITEKICEAIKNLEPLEVPNIIEVHPNAKSYCLVLGDQHYGAEFELKGLFGDVLNSYSPEIFEERMWYLLSKVKEFVEKENIEVLNVFDMGDSIDGLLRCSQLWKLRYGVVDSTILYSRFYCEWLNELSKFVKIRFQMTDGNHSELRELGMPKGTFVNDNMGKVIKEFIKVRLENNPNFTYVENPTGYIYQQMGGYNVLGIHGEVKNMEKALKDFSRIYGVEISYLIAGHLHHSKLEEVGVNSEVINVPSIIGVDDYSLKLMKTSNASAKILVFDNVDGLIADYRIKLN